MSKVKFFVRDESSVVLKSLGFTSVGDVRYDESFEWLDEQFGLVCNIKYSEFKDEFGYEIFKRDKDGNSKKINDCFWFNEAYTAKHFCLKAMLESLTNKEE